VRKKQKFEIVFTSTSCFRGSTTTAVFLKIRGINYKNKVLTLSDNYSG
jgi:hypothetical protein